MKRFLILPMVLSCVTVLAWADAPAPNGADEAPRAASLRRNIELVKKLVTGGMLLAAEEDPLNKIDHCNNLAGHLAEEVHQAAKDNENARAQEMSKHLHKWVKDGVVTNLNAARNLSIPESAWKIEIQNRAENTAKTMKELHKGLSELSGPADLKPALATIAEGLAEVERIVKIKKKIGEK